MRLGFRLCNSIFLPSPHIFVPPLKFDLISLNTPLKSVKLKMEKLGLITVRFFVLFEVHFPNYVEKELEKEGSFNCISTDLVQII